MLSGYVGSGNGIPKVLNNTSVLPARHTVVAREKAVLLVKSFTAVTADISSLAQVKIYILPEGRNILDTLHSVIVDLISFRAATGTGMRPSWQLNIYVLLPIIFPNLFYDYIFQS